MNEGQLQMTPAASTSENETWKDPLSNITMKLTGQTVLSIDIGNNKTKIRNTKT